MDKSKSAMKSERVIKITGIKTPVPLEELFSTSLKELADKYGRESK